MNAAVLALAERSRESLSLRVDASLRHAQHTSTPGNNRFSRKAILLHDKRGNSTDHAENQPRLAAEHANVNAAAPRRIVFRKSSTSGIPLRSPHHCCEVVCLYGAHPATHGHFPACCTPTTCMLIGQQLGAPKLLFHPALTPPKASPSVHFRLALRPIPFPVSLTTGVLNPGQWVVRASACGTRPALARLQT